MPVLEDIDRSTVCIAVLDDHPAWRGFQERSLKRAGFGWVRGWGADPKHLNEHIESGGCDISLVMFGLQDEREVSWENLRVVRGIFKGPIVATCSSESPTAMAKVRDLGVEQYLAIADSTEEAIELKVDTVLMTHRINSMLDENDQRTHRLFVNILTVMVKILENKDPYTRMHSHMVVKWSRMVGRRRGLSDDELDRMGQAALFHDFGKVGVPEDILNKPGRLTDEEFAVMKQHPTIAKNLLSSLDQLADLLPAIHHHHERWAGGGYPSGLKGEQIPLWARIIGLADAYDTMASKRTYKEPFTKAKIVDELVKASGKQFDPELVQILLRIVQEQP